MDDSFYKAIDGVYFVDRDRKKIYWNASAERLTGYSSSNVIYARITIT